ncbi:MAG: hypothetical protein LCH81_21980 [Bacteroidetes bacterium]|nr:hypothetical protein [Bacteroidota bacterium]
MSSRPKLYAALAVLAFFLLIALYANEYQYLSNTIGVQGLVGGSVLVGVIVAGAGLWLGQQRFTPWKRHLPEVLFIGVFSLFFAPLFGSLLNRAFSLKSYESFEFVSEQPYFASGYGVLKDEKLQPTGYYLQVRQNGQIHRFKYKKQPYYPLTKPGEVIMLPVRRGIFGPRVVLLG